MKFNEILFFVSSRDKNYINFNEKFKNCKLENKLFTKTLGKLGDGKLMIIFCKMSLK